MIKNYYSITKPGIIMGNLITAAAGFLLASRANIDILLLIEVLLGIALIIASAAIINNYIDRDIDSKMERTKNRALVKGVIASNNALIFASILGLLGFLILFYFTNILVVLMGALGFLSYVFIYTLSKRYTSFATLLGSISGATPPVAGYLCVTNNFDLGSLILFLILVFWQIPHFYAIGIYKLKDYKNAKIPILPVTSGTYVTKIHMLFYIILFTLSATLLSVFGYTGLTFLVAVFILGGVWFYKGLLGFKTVDEIKWAKGMFKYSLLVTMTVYLLISVNIVLP